MTKITKFVKGTASGFLSSFAGFLCCWNPFTAPLLIGWMNRYMLRSAVWVWIKRSNTDNPSELYTSAELAELQNWPHWLKHSAITPQPTTHNQNLLRGTLAKATRMLKTLWSQYKSGLLTLFNTWLLTLPFAICWLVIWWAGWNNYFTRSYEEYHTAPFIGLLSMMGFAIIMMYVPIAQTRQAIHGTWQSFFEILTIRTIAKHVRVRLLFLALFYAVGFTGIMAGTKVFPTFFEQIYKINFNDQKALKHAIDTHFLFVILCFYIGLLTLKRMNARVYAIGVLKALDAKDLKPEQLCPLERTLLLEKLSFTAPKEYPPRPRWQKIPLNTANKTGLALVTLATIILWWGSAFSVFFGQFINLSTPDWLNMPLIQLPYIRFPEL
ncbi:MAG: hypothetical protein KDI90_00215 [Alphaproteobacteria bacterium]|nr:hypothetical protein [Alphaproteobacteria bacterium]MCB9974687.1 hypothetical protein [Rhodospirillales bacterium]